jgi:hypothetical protein
MYHNKKIVTQLPLAELWGETGSMAVERVRYLNREAIRRFLQHGPVRFVVADVGLSLRWIAENESYVFWKAEVRPHLVNKPERPFAIYHYPHGYAYIASEWQTVDADFPIVVLERYH